MKRKVAFNSNSVRLKKLKRQKAGQVTVEYILLAVTLLVLFQVTANTLKYNQVLKNFQQTPQNVFRNMVENGNWEPNEATSRSKHPNHYEFQYADKGKRPI